MTPGAALLDGAAVSELPKTQPEQKKDKKLLNCPQLSPT